MKRNLFLVAVVVLGLCLVALQPVQSVQASNELLEFNSMMGVTRAFIASANNPVRGLLGGGLPWVIHSAQGELSANGKLELRVRGLVLDPNDPGVIAAGKAGMNPISMFKVVVSCITTGGMVVNVSTAPFPATTGLASDGGGNASLETRISLPSPCMQPVVFVTSVGGNWFAATQF